LQNKGRIIFPPCQGRGPQLRLHRCCFHVHRAAVQVIFASDTHDRRIAAMSPRRKKGTTQQNGTPAPEPTPLLLPEDKTEHHLAPPGTTNYREIHKDEAEALRSIYAEDFEDVQGRQSAWHVSCRFQNLGPFFRLERPKLTVFCVLSITVRMRYS
jgi:hypothetical protein